MASSDENSRKEVAKYEALAEAAYNEMYDARSPAARYSDLKDYFAMAIGAAERAGLHDDAKRLSAGSIIARTSIAANFPAFDRRHVSIALSAAVVSAT